MIELNKAALPVPESELRAALAAHKAALAAHARTVGVPAPWPEHDIIFEIMRHGGEFSVVDRKPGPDVPDSGVAIVDRILADPEAMEKLATALQGKRAIQE